MGRQGDTVRASALTSSGWAWMHVCIWCHSKITFLFPASLFHVTHIPVVWRVRDIKPSTSTTKCFQEICWSDTMYAATGDTYDVSSWCICLLSASAYTGRKCMREFIRLEGCLSSITIESSSLHVPVNCLLSFLWSLHLSHLHKGSFSRPPTRRVCVCVFPLFREHRPQQQSHSRSHTTTTRVTSFIIVYVYQRDSISHSPSPALHSHGSIDWRGSWMHDAEAEESKLTRRRRGRRAKKRSQSCQSPGTMKWTWVIIWYLSLSRLSYETSGQSEENWIFWQPLILNLIY